MLFLILRIQSLLVTKNESKESKCIFLYIHMGNRFPSQCLSRFLSLPKLMPLTFELLLDRIHTLATGTFYTIFNVFFYPSFACMSRHIRTRKQGVSKEMHTLRLIILSPQSSVHRLPQSISRTCCLFLFHLRRRSQSICISLSFPKLFCSFTSNKDSIFMSHH